MEEDRLYTDGDLAQFYDLENDWAPDLEFCRGLAADAGSILDLGCGTGRFAATLAEEGRRLIVGVDPARPMLDIARTRPGGGAVRWVEADARSVRLDERFDLVVLTGHAFQVFLTDADRAAVLATIAHHLSPTGRFIFDTRNPAVREWEEWSPEISVRSINHPALGEVRAWNDFEHDASTDIVTYQTFYRIAADGRTYQSSSRIAFPRRDSMAALIEDAGLSVERWYGDWTGGPFALASAEIIPLGGRSI